MSDKSGAEKENNFWGEMGSLTNGMITFSIEAGPSAVIENAARYGNVIKLGGAFLSKSSDGHLPLRDLAEVAGEFGLGGILGSIIVGNPEFQINNVPNGTKWLYFALTDFDARGYNHGGGWIKYDGGAVTESGVFEYKSPCPPNGTHTYEWSVTASGTKSLKNPLGVAASTLSYP